MKRMITSRWPAVLVGVLLIAVLVLMGSGRVTAAVGSSGIVDSVIKAPVTADGDVAGARTDIVVNLAIDMDPSVDGRSLMQGATIKVTLPDDFIPADPPLPIQQAIAVCIPSSYLCNTAVLLQGWPQRPVPPPFYTLSVEGTHTIVFTANQDIIPNTGPVLAGIKQAHLILSGYTNPKPGMYDVQIAAETVPGGPVDYGTGRVHILPKPAPSVNVTSAFSGGANTIYQTTTVGNAAPLPFNLLMWGKGGTPLIGAELVWKNASHSLLQLDGATVGHVRIDAPPGTSGYSVTATGPSFAQNAPVFGNATGRMVFDFIAAQSGDYIVTYSLNGGNSVQQFVTVTD